MKSHPTGANYLELEGSRHNESNDSNALMLPAFHGGYSQGVRACLSRGYSRFDPRKLTTTKTLWLTMEILKIKARHEKNGLDFLWFSRRLS